MQIFISTFLLLLLQGCGTFQPMPSHGGGKRFAIEQQLLSAAAKKAITDLPVSELRGKKVYLSISVIYDEGGGSVNGGRPFASETLSSITRNISARSRPTDGMDLEQKTRTESRASEYGLSSIRINPSYQKDLSLNSSDARQLTNLLSSYLLRNDILKDPDPSVDGEADFLIEITVDVLGTIWQRVDWGLKNSEELAASISYEYAIIPLKQELTDLTRKGSISYKATYKNDYILWFGPTKTELKVQKDESSSFIGDLGLITNGFLIDAKKGRPTEFSPNAPATIQIIPGIK